LLSRRTVETVLGRIIYQYLGLIYIAARRWLATIGIESLNVGNPTKQAIACRRFSWKQDKAPPDPLALYRDVSRGLLTSGLTRFLEEGGTLEGAQNIADHADSRTTKLYDRRQQIVLREDVERIRY
jgi:hypothetical protein